MEEEGKIHDFKYGKENRITGLFGVDYNGQYSVVTSATAHNTSGRLTATIANTSQLPIRTLTKYMRVFRFRFLYKCTAGSQAEITSIELLFRLLNAGSTTGLASTNCIYKNTQDTISMDNNPQIDVLVAIALSSSTAMNLLVDSKITANTTPLSNYTLSTERFEFIDLKEDAFAAIPIGSSISPYADLSEIPLEEEIYVCGIRGGFEPHFYPQNGADGEYCFDQGPPLGSKNYVNHMIHVQNQVEDSNSGRIYQTIGLKNPGNRHYPRVMADGQVDACNLGASHQLNADYTSGKNYVVQGIAQTYMFRCHTEDGLCSSEKQITDTVPDPVVDDRTLQMLNHYPSIDPLSSFNAENFALWCGVLPTKNAGYSITVYADDFPAPATDHKWTVGGLETTTLTAAGDAPFISPFGYTNREQAQNCGLIYVSFGRAEYASPSISTILVQPHYDYLSGNSFVSLGSWKSELEATIIPNTITGPQFFSNSFVLDSNFRNPSAPWCPFNFDYQTWVSDNRIQVFQGDSPGTSYLEMINGIDLTPMIEYLFPEESRTEMVVAAANLGADAAAFVINSYFGIGSGRPLLPLPRGPLLPRATINDKVSLINFIQKKGRFDVYR